jgi:hypothetical protein
MLRLASDADVNGDLVRGLRRRKAGLDLVRVQDGLPEGTPDDVVLAWAAAENRVLITNDRNTMVAEAIRRAAAQPMPGLIVATNEQPIGRAIEDVLLLVECLTEVEMKAQSIVYLPLKG